MRNKKNLLNEATIRRFMSLANVHPLSEKFLDNVEEDKEEETVEEEIDLAGEEEELPMDAGPDLGGDEPPMDEPPMDDMPAEEGEEVTLDGDQVATVRGALEDALALVGELGGEEAPMDDELPMERAKI